MMGCARDIVEQCGVPRFVFSDFPLGNPCGRPFDTQMQKRIVGLALDVLESSIAPRTTVQTPFVWSNDNSWRDRYLKPKTRQGTNSAASNGVAETSDYA